MSCRSTLGGKAASCCATAITGKSADFVPKVLHDIRREYDLANPEAHRPTGEEAAQAIEHLAMIVRQRNDLPQWRKDRAAQKCAVAAAELRQGRKVPSAAMLYAWRSLPAALEAYSPPENTDNHSEGNSHGENQL